MVNASEDLIYDLKKQLIEGLRLLVAEDVLYSAGHLSVRIPGTDTFIINPRYPANIADIEDLCIVDMKTGKRIAGPGPIPSESVIHNEILKARPDVQSVTHVHSRYATLWSLTDRPWVPFHNGAASFADGIGVVPSSEGVRTVEGGQEIAKQLGDKYACFQRGHGVNVAGPGIQGTVMLAIALESACHDAILLSSVQEPRPISAEGIFSGGVQMGKETRDKRLQNDYRTWPFLLQKHQLRPKEQIKTENKPAAEGAHLL
jgi:L-ribulose-5-phosphate 4-epimerase